MDTTVSQTPAPLAPFAVAPQAAAGGGAPEWIEIVPAGRMVGKDGRGPYVLRDPQRVVADFERRRAA
ncbi:hypothetical protein, partial [Roseospira visakhapatnamensis]|nr:phage I-like protein [Roseospira visakhapatnamensis]